LEAASRCWTEGLRVDASSPLLAPMLVGMIHRTERAIAIPLAFLFLSLAACGTEPATETQLEDTPVIVETPTAEPIPVPIETDPPTGKPFVVELTHEAIGNPDGSVTINVGSNLPDGAELMVGIVGVDGYQSSAQAVLDGGYATFGPYSDHGSPLAAGNYTLSISLSAALLQTDAVQQYIGTKGELMRGPLVVTEDDGTGQWVSFTSIVVVK
jgi:hypothetical protein